MKGMQPQPYPVRGAARPNVFAGGMVKAMESVGRQVHLGLDKVNTVLGGPLHAVFQRQLGLQINSNAFDEAHLNPSYLRRICGNLSS